MTMNQTISVFGGTGKLGSALATRLARAGHTVIIGSRDAAAAADAAGSSGFDIRGMDNVAAAEAADLVIVAVPFAAQQGTLEAIRPYVAGKIVVDTTVPLVPPRVMRVQLPEADSAAVTAQAILGDEVTVVSAFHNVAAHKMAESEPLECDVLVFGDKRDVRQQVVDLAESIGLRGIHGGALANSAAGEALTSVLLFINKLYAVDGAGIRITGKLTEPG